jgi:hypothetical protein
MSAKTTITICSSSNFYRQAVDIKAKLEAMGYEVLIPQLALRMQESGDFEVSHYKTWFGNADDYDKKAQLMRDHFAAVKKADAILVLNFEKRGVQNYIGGNVLMEMGLAFDRDEQIFVLNEIPEESSFLEEILGLGSIPLHGKLDALAKQLPPKQK